jgi:hypothetical protein
MKYIFWLFIALIFFSCKKEKQSGEYVYIIYEIQTSDTGFTYVRTVEYDPAIGANPNTIVEWSITATGTFQKTVKIKRGFMAEITAAHPTSNRWKLNIKYASGELLASADNPTFFPAPTNSFYAGFGIIVN